MACVDRVAAPPLVSVRSVLVVCGIMRYTLSMTLLLCLVVAVAWLRLTSAEARTVVKLHVRLFIIGDLVYPPGDA